MTDLWLTIRTPDGVHCWALGDPDDTAREDLILRAQVVAGLAADHDPQSGAVMLAPGEPHATTLATATIHDVAELARVAPAAVTTARTVRDDTAKAEHVRAIRQQLDALDPTTKDVVLAAYGRVPAALPTKAPR